MRLGARASRPHRVSAGKMGIEKLTQYTGLAVGLKPAATECEARLRGLERIMYSRPYIWLLRLSMTICKATM
jgi:hypothetical protein